jgi:CCR4-NOT transcription complex subunit 6
MCYNILCNKYATSQMYFYCPPWALEWNYRKSRILVEIQRSNPDILCLQELEMAQFEEYFSPELADQGYHGGFYPKSRSRTMNEKERRTVDGCAIFYKSQRL